MTTAATPITTHHFTGRLSLPLPVDGSWNKNLTLGKADRGYKYRLRVDYVPGSNPSNLGADSPWQHFMVEK